MIFTPYGLPEPGPAYLAPTAALPLGSGVVLPQMVVTIALETPEAKAAAEASADGLVLLPADPWDVAAGLLLVEDAGLVAGGLAGGPNPTGHQGILATSSALFPPAAALLDPSPLPG